MTKTMDEIEAVRRGLDAFAAWAAAHPDLPMHSSRTTWIVADHRMENPDHAEIVRAIADGAPIGDVRKIPSDINGGTMFIERHFGGGVSVQHQAPRAEVCERVVVGTETVEVPDPAAPMVEVERDVVEWRCAPLLNERTKG